MGNEANVWQKSEVAKLPLLSFAAMESPDRSGMVTPPFHTSVSVPFGWEEEPGKPKNTSSNSNNTTTTETNLLQLPPRLVLMDHPKVPPSITPQKPMFHLPKQCCATFRFHTNQIGAMVFRKRQLLMDDWFPWFRNTCFPTKTQVRSAAGSVFPSSEERSSSKMKVAWTQQEGSFSNCEGRRSSMTKIAMTEKEGSFSTCIVQGKRKHRRRVETDQHSLEEQKKHKKECW